MAGLVVVAGNSFPVTALLSCLWTPPALISNEFSILLDHQLSVVDCFIYTYTLPFLQWDTTAAKSLNTMVTQTLQSNIP